MILSRVGWSSPLLFYYQLCTLLFPCLPSSCLIKSAKRNRRIVDAAFNRIHGFTLTEIEREVDNPQGNRGTAGSAGATSQASKTP